MESKSEKSKESDHDVVGCLKKILSNISLVLKENKLPQ